LGWLRDIDWDSDKLNNIHLAQFDASASLSRHTKDCSGRMKYEKIVTQDEKKLRANPWFPVMSYPTFAFE